MLLLSARNCTRHARPRFGLRDGAGMRALRHAGAYCSAAKEPIVFEGLGTSTKDKEGAVLIYDQWAETYDATLKSWGYTAPAEMAQLLRTLGVQQGEPVLDAGCGTGLSGEALTGAGFTLLSGCDVSPRSIEVLQAKVLYSELKVADLEIQEGPLPFADDSFSAAVTVGVTSYISRFELLFPELLRVVRPGGIVAFTHRGPNASITAQDDQDGLAVEDEHALGLWDSDYRGVRSAAQSLVDEGRWEEAHTSGLQPYMPRNPDPAESNKRIRYHAYRRVR